MTKRDQSLCLGLGPAFFLVVVIGLGIAGFIPPMSPTMTAQQVAEFYATHTTNIRVGLLLFNVFGVLVIPFFIVITQHMKRMRLSSAALPYTYLMCVAGSAGLYLFADIAWLVAAFRPQRDAGSIELLNDLGWLCFTAPIGIIVIQLFTLGVAILLDDPRRPVFATWVGWFNIAAGIALLPAVMSVIYRTGPLAWDGEISFWARNVTVAVYIAVMYVVVRHTLRQPTAEQIGTTA